MERWDLVAERLVRERKRQGLTQSAAAREIGISEASLSNIERGYVPGDLIQFKIRRWLGQEPFQEGGECLGLEERLRRQRMRLGLPKRKAAPEIGLSLRTIVEVEQGVIPGGIARKKIRRWLGEE